MNKEMKTLNGYEVVDAKAREDISLIEVPTKLSQLENDKSYQTAEQVTQLINTAIGDIENGTY